MLNKAIVLIARAYYWLAERLYHELAWAYDPISRLVSLGQWDSWRRLVLPFVQGELVLEIGFGTAELLIELSHSHLFTTGLEASAAMQRVAARKVHKLKLDIPRLQGVSQALPFHSSSFDTIISTFPSNYIFDPLTWSEAYRVLRSPTGEGSSGGRFIVVGVCLVTTRRWFFKARPDGTPLLGQIMDRFEALAQGAGLQIQVNNCQVGSLILPVLVAEKADPPAVQIPTS